MYTDRVRRFCIVGIGVATLALMQSAFAQSPRSYAVLSLIGDKLEIVTAVAETGSHLDRNRRNSIAMDNPVFDNAALGSADTAISQLEPNAKVTLLSSNEAKLFEAQERILETDADGNALFNDVLKAEKDSQASRVILIVKHRGEAILKTGIGNIGHGKLKGLGFYVEPRIKLSRSDTGETGQGFLAPFCYIKVILLDAYSGVVLRSESSASGTTLSAARAKDSGQPWAVLSPQEKITAIERMVKRETSRLVSLVLTE
jgi:hypothetical protein